MDGGGVKGQKERKRRGGEEEIEEVRSGRRAGGWK